MWSQIITSQTFHCVKLNRPNESASWTAVLAMVSAARRPVRCRQHKDKCCLETDIYQTLNWCQDTFVKIDTCVYFNCLCQANALEFAMQVLSCDNLLSTILRRGWMRRQAYFTGSTHCPTSRNPRVRKQSHVWSDPEGNTNLVNIHPRIVDLWENPVFAFKTFCLLRNLECVQNSLYPES